MPFSANTETVGVGVTELPLPDFDYTAKLIMASQMHGLNIESVAKLLLFCEKQTAFSRMNDVELHDYVHERLEKKVTSVMSISNYYILKDYNFRYDFGHVPLDYYNPTSQEACLVFPTPQSRTATAASGSLEELCLSDTIDPTSDRTLTYEFSENALLSNAIHIPPDVLKEIQAGMGDLSDMTNRTVEVAATIKVNEHNMQAVPTELHFSADGKVIYTTDQFRQTEGGCMTRDAENFPSPSESLSRRFSTILRD